MPDNPTSSNGSGPEHPSDGLHQRPRPGPSGTGYLVLPEAGHGPGVLVLHSWWGLTPFFKQVCDRLADAGFVALAPDLHGGGRTTDDPTEAERWLLESDTNVTADLVLSSAATLRNLAQTPDAPIGVIGWSMGASWALWLASRAPDQVGAFSFFYGTQAIDRLEVRSAALGHFAETDEFESDDDIVAVEAALRLGDFPVEVHRYAGTRHWFFEPGANFHPEAAELAWDRTVAFLHEHLEHGDAPPPDHGAPTDDE